tara:strand:- start:55 stop:579 length:525 start_codon:yes stop_codon:yes gene_type:complete
MPSIILDPYKIIGNEHLKLLPGISSGNFPIKKFSRIDMSDLKLVSNFSWTIKFVDNIFDITGNILIKLQCKRCLRFFTKKVEINRQYRVFYTNSEAEKKDFNNNFNYETISIDQQTTFFSLFEDELILELTLLSDSHNCNMNQLVKELCINKEIAQEHEDNNKPFRNLRQKLKK